MVDKAVFISWKLKPREKKDLRRGKREEEKQKGMESGRARGRRGKRDETEMNEDKREEDEEWSGAC